MNLLETELGELKSELIDMTYLVRGQLDKAISSFYSFDKDLAKEVIKNEKRVNGSELKIDAKGEHILALFNPVAIDLRFVVASLKMVSDLERIGDNAKGIAQYVIKCENSYDADLIEKIRFKEMTDTALEMLSILSESFETDNTKLARTLFTKDERMDEINLSANQIMTDYLKNQTDPDKILQAIYFLTIIRKMERVGDYVTNIAEEIIFYVKAKVLRHKRKSFKISDTDSDSDSDSN
ncbi:MAG: phosphate signaling complex protein PhoU [Sporocytophaga sp.]|uniref:phosphate signaling complex protein PhoU n=1 Tax=Sporocytophaga sp. TaxID=2231183 RepID=UPI001B0443A0|nr:phosphate signaling complex protein PhoU [Sporocytophaga sp.]MBO9698980.1 phosphate signaling complex protein PhoU [Sporocytophaga sp.]